ncbi:MAG: flagellar filament capping protein FliD [Methylococcaceae bacterium]
MAGVTSLGLGSGIDVRSIVDGLVAAERGPQESSLTRQEADLQAKLSSFGIFKSALAEVRTSLAGLNQGSDFGKLTGTSSNEEVVGVSVSSNAEQGSYKVESKQLAQAHSLASVGFAESNDIVGTGTITIKFGQPEYTENEGTGELDYAGFKQNSDRGTLTLTLDETNNTLVGMRDAINEQDAGVSASIIYDGSAYRLVMSSEETGLENSMKITVDDPSLSQFEYNENSAAMEETLIAQDAIMSINGLDVTNSSNKFDKALKGVNIDLKDVAPGKTIELNIERSTAGLGEALQGFVEKYNELAVSVKSLTAYDPTSKKGSILLGDATVRTGMGQIRSVLGSMVSGLEKTTIRTIADLGVTTESDGQLKFDGSKLEAALERDPEGVASIFTVLGRPDNDGVKYVSSSDDTEVGAYSINISQAATTGELAGANNSISSLVVAEGVNDSFKIRVDGNLSASLKLTAGTYASADELATEIQALINGDKTLRGADAKVQVTFDTDNNRFVMKSSSFGSESTIDITESTAGALGLSVAEGVVGTDVEGTINGVAAEGKGQHLIGKNDLKLFIAESVIGDLGKVNFSRGLMERLDGVFGGLLDSDGSLATKTKGLQKTLDGIADDRIKLDDKVQKYEARMLKRFNSMDAILGQFQATGGFLSQQLANLPYNNLSK